MKRLNLILVMGIIFSFMICGCSGGSNPLLPYDTLSGGNDAVQESREPGADSHFPLGFYRAEFNAETNEIELTQNRQLLAHISALGFLVPPYCSDCLQISVVGGDWDAGILNLRVVLSNPFPVLSAFDPRFIIDPETDGYSITNPATGSPDGYTDLWDQWGDKRNPFIAFCKDQPNREAKAQTSHESLIDYHFPTTQGGFHFSFEWIIIDVCYPENCEEPYEIVDINLDDTEIPKYGGDIGISCEVHGWPGNEPQTVTAVIESLDETETYYSVELDNTSGEYYEAILSPSGAVPPGTHNLWLKADSVTDPGLYMWQYVGEVEIVEGPISWETNIAQTWGSEHPWESGGYNCIDTAGNIYVTGKFQGTVDFNPGPGVDEITASHASYISKFNSQGEYLWVRVLKQEVVSGSVRSNDIACDPEGNVYVTGDVHGTIDFDPGPEVFEVTSNGYTDAFLLKLDGNGYFKWVKNWGSGNVSPIDNYKETGRAVEASANDVIVTGRFWETADFDPGDGEDIHSSNGGQDIFLSMFDTSGNFIWARTWGSADAAPMYEDGVSIARTDTGKILVTGDFEGLCDFNPDGNPDIHESNGYGDIFLTCFDESGYHEWAHTWGSTKWENSCDVIVDEQGSILLTGVFSGDVDFDPGPDVHIKSSKKIRDPFLLKLGSTVSFSWVNVGGGGGMIAHDAQSIFIFGSYLNIVDFDPGPGIDERTSNGQTDICLSHYDFDGNYKCVVTYGGDDFDSGKSISIDNNGYLILSGTYRSTVDFDPGDGVEIHQSNGGNDFFLMRLPAECDYTPFNWQADLAALGIVQAIQLDWEEPIDDPGFPVGYNVYRSDSSTIGYEDPDGGFYPDDPAETGLVKINDEPLTLTQYLDLTVVGSQEYFYRARLVDMTVGDETETDYWSNEASAAANEEDGIYYSDEIELYEEPGFEDLFVEVASRELLIYYDHKSYAEMCNLVSESHSTIVGQLPEMYFIQVVVEDNIPLIDEVLYFEEYELVHSAYPNYIIEADGYPEGEPEGPIDDDVPPQFTKEWHFYQVSAPDAWDLLGDTAEVLVGIVDTGLDYDNFYDFAIGGDKDGRILHSSWEPEITDYDGHGTHVAGIIGADGNGTGTLGMAWKTLIHPYNTRLPNGKISSARITAGIKALVDQDCRVINMSLGISWYKIVEWDIPGILPQYKAKERYENRFLYQYAAVNGVILVVSGGNNYNFWWRNFIDSIPMGHYKHNSPGSEWGWTVDYETMAQFEAAFPGVIFVSATDDLDEYAWFSDRGPVERISAPGVYIWSGWSTDGIKYAATETWANGTSMAAPMVAGLAALILSVDPDLQSHEVIDIIYNTCDINYGQNPPVHRINAYSAISSIQPPQNQPPTAAAHAGLPPFYKNHSINFYSDSTDPDGWSDIVKYEWDFYFDGSFNGTVLPHNVSHIYTSTGNYQVQLKVTDSVDHTDMLDTPLYINVVNEPQNQPPVAFAKASPNPQVAGELVYFQDNGSYDPDGHITLFEWDWNNDGFFDEPGEPASHSWSTPGTYYVQFRVTDNGIPPLTDTLDTPLEIEITSGYECGEELLVDSGPGWEQIRDRWKQDPDHCDGPLGWCLDGVSGPYYSVIGTLYYKAEFEFGNIYYIPSSGTYAVFGDIFEHWNEGVCGYPEPWPDGGDFNIGLPIEDPQQYLLYGRWCQSFERGGITSYDGGFPEYCGTWTLQGAIWTYWKTYGVSSAMHNYGCATSGEIHVSDDLIRQNFEYQTDICHYPDEFNPYTEDCPD